MADLGRAAREAAARREKAAHDKAAVGANKAAEAAAGSTINTSAAGLGAYAKKMARPTPGPRVTPTPMPTPKISTPMDESITAK